MAVDRVLVTGASGFIASHIIQQLLRAGHKVRGTVRDLNNQLKINALKQLCPDSAHPVELVEADLLKPDTWKAAVSECTHVVHVASPVAIANPEDENKIIKPAVDGTLNVLKACKASGSVTRVVLTSSVAAVIHREASSDHLFSEADWTDLTKPGTTAYRKSKTLAEKAAWEYVSTQGNSTSGPGLELAVMNPSLVLGPVILANGGNTSPSLEFHKRLLNGSFPLLPQLHFGCVDVRDVAKAHVIALSCDQASGQRHLLSSHGGWIQDIAKTLNEELRPHGYHITTTVAPNSLMWLVSFFNKELAALQPQLGKVLRYNNNRMKCILGIEPIPFRDTIIDTAYSLIESGVIAKTHGYTGPRYSTSYQ